MKGLLGCVVLMAAGVFLVATGDATVVGFGMPLDTPVLLAD